ncbi:uncharacterized protein hdly [Hetaerina americana]|uniref:uncharacterized protein hdly n=1 Tax=Hetaerina americana TaxID=62018 RepID=UPI003A7F1006
MLLIRDLLALALLVVACGANGISHRFFFPSQTLLLDTPDAKLGSGHGRRVSANGEASEGGGGGRGYSSSSNSGSQGSNSLPEASPAPASQGVGSVRKIREPSRCTFAIVGCCRAGSVRIDDHCFGQFQCHGPFWGESPCRRESAVVAYNIVSRYYEAKEAEKLAQEAASEAPGLVMAMPAREPEPSSPFDPIGPLPSREDAMKYQG